MRGASPVKTSPDVEKWMAFRENIHKYYRLTPKNLTYTIIAIGVIPYALYKGIIYSQYVCMLPSVLCADCVSLSRPVIAATKSSE